MTPSITSLSLSLLPGQLLWDLPEAVIAPPVQVGGGDGSGWQWRPQPLRRPRRAPESLPPPPFAPAVRHARAELTGARQIGAGSARVLPPEDEMLKRLLALVLLETEDA